MGLFSKLFGESQLTEHDAIAGTLIGAMLCVQPTSYAMIHAWAVLKEIPIFNGYDDWKLNDVIDSFASGKRKVDADFLQRAAGLLTPNQRSTLIEWVKGFMKVAGSPQRGKEEIWKATPEDSTKKLQDYIHLLESTFALREGESS